MSLHDHEAHDRAPRARRDLLGLSALLGPDSQYVPISDLDGGAVCGGHVVEAAGREPSPDALVACGSCTTRCEAVTPLLERGARSATTKDTP
jgi:hypothetical protein